MNITEVQGFFTIDLKNATAGTTTIDTTTNISYRIPKDQVIRLRGYRVQMTSQANALAKRILYIDVPWISSAQVINNSGVSGIPIELDNAVVTIRDSLNKPVYLTRPIEQNFKIRVLNDTGSPEVEVANITLQFETEKSGLRF
jgi:hypothetical protein